MNVMVCVYDGRFWEAVLDSCLIFFYYCGFVVTLRWLQYNLTEPCFKSSAAKDKPEPPRAEGQQSRICDRGFQPRRGTAPDAVVFVIRFCWDSASATGRLYSAGAAERHIQSAHFVFKKVVISWQFWNNYGQSAPISPKVKHRITHGGWNCTVCVCVSEGFVGCCYSNSPASCQCFVLALAATEKTGPLLRVPTRTWRNRREQLYFIGDFERRWGDRRSPTIE